MLFLYKKRFPLGILRYSKCMNFFFLKIDGSLKVWGSKAFTWTKYSCVFFSFLIYDTKEELRNHDKSNG